MIGYPFSFKLKPSILRFYGERLSNLIFTEGCLPLLSADYGGPLSETETLVFSSPLADDCEIYSRNCLNIISY